MTCAELLSGGTWSQDPAVTQNVFRFSLDGLSVTVSGSSISGFPNGIYSVTSNREVPGTCRINGSGTGAAGGVSFTATSTRDDFTSLTLGNGLLIHKRESSSGGTQPTPATTGGTQPTGTGTLFDAIKGKTYITSNQIYAFNINFQQVTVTTSTVTPSVVNTHSYTSNDARRALSYNEEGSEITVTFDSDFNGATNNFNVRLQLMTQPTGTGGTQPTPTGFNPATVPSSPTPSGTGGTLLTKTQYTNSFGGDRIQFETGSTTTAGTFNFRQGWSGSQTGPHTYDNGIVTAIAPGTSISDSTFLSGGGFTFTGSTLNFISTGAGTGNSFTTTFT
jgi:hypothetical protein